MRKIPTIFVRSEPDGRITDRPHPDCAWVFAGEGRATEKLDGTNVRLSVVGGKVVGLEKRRNPSRQDKANGIVEPWYVPASQNEPADRWIWEAARRTSLAGVPDGEHCAEALGPSIQGNPLKLPNHLCVLFDLHPMPLEREIPTTFEGLRELLATLESRFSPGCLAAGIVWHHADGRRAKIKRKDFLEDTRKRR